MKEQSIIFLVVCLVSGTLSKPPPSFLEYKDSYGQYSFGYSAPGSARSEVRSLDGSTRGSYSYVDDAGVIQSTQYTADGVSGFQVVATNLPRAPSPVVDTPEVTAARLAHLKALEDAKKLAEESSEKQGQPEAKIDEKDGDTVVIENSARSAESEMASDAHAKLAEEVKEAVVESQEENAAEEAMPVQSRTQEAVQSDVPVVTTSFVIPGTLNLHSRIELVQDGAARLSSEPSALPVNQPSLLQDSDLNPSLMTPASTKLKTMSSSERENMLLKIAPIPDGASMPSALHNYKHQPYSVSFVPGVIARSNIIAVPYSIGSSPLYPQYNPYHQYFPFGIL